MPIVSIFDDHDSGTGAFTAQQNSRLYAIFEECMIEALRGSTALNSAPTTHVIIRAPAMEQNSSKKKKSGADDGEEDNDDDLRDALMQFPLYRNIDDKWTIILRNPDVLISGDFMNSDQIIKRSALGAESDDDDDEDSDGEGDDGGDAVPGFFGVAAAKGKVADALGLEKRRRKRLPASNKMSMHKAAVAEDDSTAQRSKKENTSRRIKCDYAVLQIKYEKPERQAGKKPDRRKRVE